MGKLVLIGLPLVAIFLGVGLAWVIGAAGVTAYLATGQGEFLAALPRRVFSSLDIFALMAMPLFILVGELMNRGGITHALIRFSALIVGRARGGLGHVNIATSVFFAGISGSALADAAALSTTLTPVMREKGYTAEYAGAITAASSMIGPIIPPSIILIFYGAIMAVDVAALFAAAVVPGLLLAGALFVANAIYARIADHPAETERPPVMETVSGAAPALMMPVVIIAGIVFGLVTPTEAGALAVIAAVIVAALLRSLSRPMLIGSVARATRLTGAIFSLLVAGAVINFLAALVGIPEIVQVWTQGMGLDLGGFLLLLLGIFLVSGMILDTQIALVLIAPILAPAAYALGADPVHLGIVICMTITLGMITPPLGGAVLIVSSVTGASYMRLMQATAPFVLLEIALVVMLTFMPDLVLALPRALGLL
jgi:tripartite ATP-independent transporter DctM subunit